MKKNNIKILLFSSSILLFSFGVSAQNNNNKVESKPISTPLKKQSPRFVAVEKPISKSDSSSPEKVSNEKKVIGEGKYLTFTKKIMEYSITGQIPEGFPKHKKGQTKEQYIKVIKAWAKENKDKIKPEYHNKIN